MFILLRTYLQYFMFCWKARKLITECEFFMELEEDKGKRYKLEIRNLDRKIKIRARQKTLTKGLYYRSLLYEALNNQDEDNFAQELMYPFVLLAMWGIARNNKPKLESIIDPVDTTREEE